jgi:hypothetical protein
MPGAGSLAELEWEGRPERPSLRRAIRHQLRRLDPTIRVVAEAFLGEESPIDLLAVGGEGEIISIRIGQDAEDARLLTQSLADLTWLRPRLGDFLKLAPGLGIEPSAEPRAMIFSTHFARETRAAVENFPSRQIELLTYHCFRQQGQLAVLFEACAPPHAHFPTHDAREPRTAGHAHPLEDPSLTSPPSPSGFRTGLRDRDLVSALEEEKKLD